jgi:hypothetical protein
MDLVSGKNLYKAERTIIIRFKEDIMNIIKIINLKVIVIKIEIIKTLSKRKGE